MTNRMKIGIFGSQNDSTVDGAFGRGTRAARALMRGAMRFAVTGGYSRVEWGTAEENLRARAFYAKLGTAPAARLSYRLEDEALAEAAREAGLQF